VLVPDTKQEFVDEAQEENLRKLDSDVETSWREMDGNEEKK
jgi:hypothetical protein